MRHLILLLLLNTVCHRAFAETPSEAPPATPSLRFELALEKSTFEVGEPIEATIRLLNGDGKIVFPMASSEVSGRHSGYGFIVRNAAGEPLKDPMNEYISLMHSLSGGRAPGASDAYTCKLFLNYRFQPLSPGKYTVHGIYQPSWRGPKVKAESPTIAFEIAETPTDSLGRRVSQLTQEWNTAPDPARTLRLLGFTGSQAAIPPLVDALYGIEHLQVAAVEALLYIDHEAVKKALLDSLKKRGPRDRMVHLLTVYLQARPDEAIPLFRKWLKVRDADTRYAAIEGIRLMQSKQKDPALVRILRPGLKDPDYKVRMNTAATIGSYATSEALDALKLVINDPMELVRDQTTSAVGWIATSKEAGPALREEAREILLKTLQSGGRPAQQAVYWLGRTGDKATLDDLKRASESTQDPLLKQKIEQAIKELNAQPGATP